MYYLNKTFSGVLRGAGGRHVKSLTDLLYFDATCLNFAHELDTYRLNKQQMFDMVSYAIKRL